MKYNPLIQYVCESKKHPKFRVYLIIKSLNMFVFIT